MHRLLGLGTRAIPRFNERQRLPYDVIVVDEASMLDLSLAQMLFAAIPQHSKLILLGDAEQLASVDVGAVWRIFRMSMPYKPTVPIYRPAAVLYRVQPLVSLPRFIQQQEQQQTTDRSSG